jgi:hypothetical protein
LNKRIVWALTINPVDEYSLNNVKREIGGMRFPEEGIMADGAQGRKYENPHRPILG